MLYAYTATDSDGLPVSGTQHASSIAALVSDLKRKKMRVLGIDVVTVCYHCGKRLTKWSWFNPFKGTSQCHRLWCRIKSGHWLWWKYKRKVRWKTLCTVTIKIPTGLVKTKN